MPQAKIGVIGGTGLILAGPGSGKTRVIAVGWLTLLPFVGLIALIRQAKG